MGGHLIFSDLDQRFRSLEFLEMEERLEQTPEEKAAEDELVRLAFLNDPNSLRHGFKQGVAWARENDWGDKSHDDEARIAELEAENKKLEKECDFWNRRSGNCDTQMSDLTGGLSVDEFKKLILELQKAVAEL